MKKIVMPVFAVLLFLVSAGVGAPAEAPSPNAALRYWMAFAMMENPPMRGQEAQRLERMARNDEPWDDAVVDDLLNRNAEALAIMHRASKLGSCDWGLEYERQAAAPMAYIPRARALARLNLLHVTRLLRRGQVSAAVEAGLDGVRFSRDVAAGGPWLAAAVSAPAMEVHLKVLTRAVREGKVDAARRSVIAQDMRALPTDGFDWSVPARLESEEMSAMLSAMVGAMNPEAWTETLASMFSGPSERAQAARTIGVSEQQLADLRAMRPHLDRARATLDSLHERLVEGFRAPWRSGNPVFAELDATARRDPLLGFLWPRSVGFDEARGTVVQARAALLDAAGAR
jgi:hypothetical protein